MQNTPKETLWKKRPRFTFYRLVKPLLWKVLWHFHDMFILKYVNISLITVTREILVINGPYRNVTFRHVYFIQLWHVVPVFNHMFMSFKKKKKKDSYMFRCFYTRFIYFHGCFIYFFYFTRCSNLKVHHVEKRCVKRMIACEIWFFSMEF